MDYSDEVDENQQPARSSGRPHREVNSRYMDDDNQPSTSSGVTRKAKITRRVNKALKEEQMLNNIPEELYKPPEWLTEVMPKRTPYFPQTGDEVIYFRKGHSLYIEAVRKNKVYSLQYKQHKQQAQPIANKNVSDQQLVKIKEINYEIKPPNMVILKMAIIDEETMRETGETFTLRYHDMPDVIDFLVLKQYYDNSIQREWKPNDRFRSIIDNKWWFGTIKCIEQDDRYPNCEFQNIKVVWDTKEEENMSAWDLEPCTEEELSLNEIPDGLPINDEELERLMYIPKREDWPECGRDLECDRLIRGLGKIMQTSWAEYFNAPVDLNEYSDYAKIIAYPVDLNTIKARLENRFYRSIDAVKFDVNFIERNARIYNEAYSMITRDAKIVTYLFREFINRLDCEDPTVIQQEIQKNKDMFESTESEFEEDQRIVTRKGKKAKNEPNWVIESKRLLSELFRNVDSEPFRTPVDLNEYEDYLSKVNTPMDLSTIKEQLLSGCYSDPKDLNRDLKLIFTNSKLYNTDKRSMIYTMTLRMQSLVNECMKNILNNHKQEQLNQLDKQQQKSTRNKKLANGKANRKRRSDHNSSAEPQPTTSRYQSNSNHYTNGHDKQSTSQQRPSRGRRIKLENSDDEDFEIDESRNNISDDDYRPYNNNVRKTKKRKAATYTRTVESEDATDVSEEEEVFNVSIENEETELDEQTEQEATDDETYGRRSSRRSTKRKRSKRIRKPIKKMKLTNGNSYKGR